MAVSIVSLAFAYAPSLTRSAVHVPRRVTTMKLAEEAVTVIDDSAWTVSKTGLRYLDSVVGDGEQMKDGDKVYIHYTGKNALGEVFDSSTAAGKSGNPLKFEIGAGMIIPGWNEGVKSMKIGGKRTLSIPPELGFGATGSPDGKVKPNAKIFVECELVQVERGGFKIAGLDIPKYDPRGFVVIGILAIPYLLPPGTLPDEIAFIWGK